MSGVNSKKKGNKAERDVAKWFKEWTGMDFQRVPQSGGLRWQKADNISGDIICADYDHNREFPFSIEVKSYNSINFEHLIVNNKTNQVLKFWEQAKDDAKRAGKIPLLFMRYNGMKAGAYFVGCPLSILRKIRHKTGLTQTSYFKVFNKDFSFAILHTDQLAQISYKDLKFLIDGKKG